jgi:hypothetical protein
MVPRSVAECSTARNHDPCLLSMIELGTVVEREVHVTHDLEPTPGTTEADESRRMD